MACHLTLGGRAHQSQWLSGLEMVSREKYQGQTTAVSKPRKIMVMHTNKKKANSVNGASSTREGTSLGTVNHGNRQVVLDRHHATACNTKDTIKIATWNVRSLCQPGELDNVKLEISRLGITILGLCKVRWKGAGKIQSNNLYTLVEKNTKKALELS